VRKTPRPGVGTAEPQLEVSSELRPPFSKIAKLIKPNDGLGAGQPAIAVAMAYTGAKTPLGGVE